MSFHQSCSSKILVCRRDSGSTFLPIHFDLVAFVFDGAPQHEDILVSRPSPASLSTSADEARAANEDEPNLSWKETRAAACHLKRKHRES